MRSILVTGGAGYVGSGLLSELLLKGYRVTCIDNLMFGGESLLNIWHNKNFTFYNCDINDNEKLNEIFSKNNFDAVIHLAAIVGDPACKLYSNLAIETNLDSSKRLIDRCKELGISKFIFASTCSNYGKMDDPEAYVDENSILAPVSLYAELKVKFEKYMLNEMKKDSKFSPTSLRFSTVYGLSPRMRFDLTVNEFTKDLALGKELVIFGEKFWRPYCHVKDVARAIIYSINDNKKINIFNVGNSKQNYSKKFVIDAIGNFLPLNNLTFSEQKISDKRDYKVNFNKISKELKFKTKYDLNFGINETIKFLKKYKKNNFYQKIYSNT